MEPLRFNALVWAEIKLAHTAIFCWVFYQQIDGAQLFLLKKQAFLLPHLAFRNRIYIHPILNQEPKRFCFAYHS